MVAAAVSAAVVLCAVLGIGAGVCVGAVREGGSGGEERRELLEAGGAAVRAGGLIVIFGHADFGDISAGGALVVKERHVVRLRVAGERKTAGGRLRSDPAVVSIRSSSDLGGD